MFSEPPALKSVPWAREKRAVACVLNGRPVPPDPPSAPFSPLGAPDFPSPEAVDQRAVCVAPWRGASMFPPIRGPSPTNVGEVIRRRWVLFLVVMVSSRRIIPHFRYTGHAAIQRWALPVRIFRLPLPSPGRLMPFLFSTGVFRTSYLSPRGVFLTRLKTSAVPPTTLPDIAGL